MSRPNSSKRKAPVIIAPPPPSIITKDEVKSGIESGKYTLQDRAGNSSVWASFQAVHDESSQSYTGYVRCRECHALYIHKKGSSPSTLGKHVCAKFKQSQATKLQNLPDSASISEKRKLDIRDCFVEWCGRDLRPFNIVTGKGFRLLLQEFVDIGADYGRVDVKDLIPHPTTISRHVEDVANNLRNKFMPEVKNNMAKGLCSLETDMWSDRYTKTSYLTVTSQHISDHWSLESNVLLTTAFPTEEAKTGANIKKEIENQMHELNFTSSDLQKATFVTDQGSNVKLALKDYNQIPCVAHLLATVLRHTLDEDNFLKSQAPDIMVLLRTARNLVTYLKKTGLCKLLDSTVKQMIETRWNTVFDELQSICVVFNQIVDILAQRNEMKRLDGWNGTLASELVTFLSKFQEVTDELQAKNVPTMHLVLIRVHELYRHCDNDLDEENELQPDILKVKERAKDYLQQKIEMTGEHYAATFLCPNIRQLKLLSDEEKQKAHDAVQQLHSELANLTDEVGNDEDTPVTSKKGRYGDWEESDAGDVPFMEEMRLYISLGKPDSDQPDALLQWWKARQSTFPNLARLARKVLAIPATSASAERNFSRAGLTVTEKRSSLDPARVNDLLLIHNYYLVGSECILKTFLHKIQPYLSTDLEFFLLQARVGKS